MAGYQISSLLVFVTIVRSITSIKSNSFTGPGTPPEIQDIVIGRCEDFKLGYVNPKVPKEILSDTNCTELWELFYSAFAYRDPCDVTQESYDSFKMAAAHEYAVDTALFWDGWDIYDTVTQFAYGGRRRTTLDTTLIGYMGNYLYFCGSTTDPSGMDMTACPAEGECDFGLGSIDAFWAMASTYFAEHAAGKTRLFLNSNRPGGAFHLSDSFFTEYELSTITSDTVTFFDTELITFFGETPGDTCTSKSIQELTNILDDKGIPHECNENSRDVLHMMCIDSPDEEDCTSLLTSGCQPLYADISCGFILLLIHSVLIR
ncbi:ADP-ribosyl cyclase/cyclic ADP-ribose hydrolase-like [Glandiceps talaboti]